ncbi:MAG TPA: SMI1/KNR4 family protein [Herpetosiphonaceae bacterium]
MELSFANHDQPPATKREIQLLQTLREIKLPPPYRDFLLTTNGGVPSLTHVPAGGGHIVHFFYSLVAKQRWADLAWSINTLDGRLPRDLIAFASDPCGNQFCIGVAGQRFGQVYIWDHEDERDEDDEDRYGNLTLLAPSFDQFLALLEPLPPELAPVPPAADDDDDV